ncbi:unnamed protein product [Arctia plantaginis]|uniref:Uncharacterized protein n=1 Tax=Arctia plantaginis TaxID=874455 RepID=A0A8S0Z1Y8_ARCPL|nr:unnamed protein product [Arctia plantaginis]
MGNTTTKFFPKHTLARHSASFYYYQEKFAIRSIPASERTPMLVLRIITLTLLVILLVMHVRSLRVFRWEQSVSGGVLVTYLIAVFGLLLATSTNRNGGKALQAYICSTGAAFLAANGAAIYGRWRYASELTRAVAELLFALGVPLRRQVILKVFLSIATGLCLAIDLALVAFFASISPDKDKDT